MDLHHPTLPDVSVQVDESRAADWLAQGWTQTTEPQAGGPGTTTTPRRRAATQKEK